MPRFVAGNTDGGNGKIHFEDCRVSAQIDVNNDVCANYQYYAYRYAGMMIGSVRHNTTDANGREIPVMDGISANNCTVNYGNWNNYYYCELVANSIASYTHDYQFSRLTQVQKIEGNTVYNMDGTTSTIPASGRANYVIVDGSHSTENATCYHFVDGKVHNHDDYNGDGVEDYEPVDINGDGVFLLAQLGISSHLYRMLPYLVTLVVLAFTSKKSRAPKAEGIPYDKGTR